jgi:hypothetical protein
LKRQASTAPFRFPHRWTTTAALMALLIWSPPAAAQSPFQSAPGPLGQSQGLSPPRPHVPRARSSERDDEDMSSTDDSSLPAATVVPIEPKPEPPQEITQDFTVAGTAMPWPWQINGLNGGFSYGYGDGTPATLIGYNVFRFRAGDRLTIRYSGGSVRRGPSYAAVDANGDSGLTVVDGRVSYVDLPSKYVAASHAVNVMRLIGAFATIDARIIDMPFVLGDGPTMLTVPPGATELLLGFNDDHFNQNSGTITVSITGLKQVPGGPNH